MVKRAICLAGGGPAVGLSLGALKRLHEADIRFDVWSCACIGAWAGVVWNQAPQGQEWATTEEFFRGIFRPDDIYARFPIATPFAPDLNAMVMNTVEFMLDPKTYQNLVVPEAIARAADSVLRFVSDPRQWSIGNFNSMLLNDVLAVNPISRFMTSMIYLSPTRGLSRIWYKHSDFLNKIDFKALHGPDKPYLYINAYNITRDRVDQFSNRDDSHGDITSKSLCACSALPYIEEPVEINGDMYCEGATIDTVNFQGLAKFHGDLDEIWVSRIVDKKQARPPQNLYDALNNLVMLFAASVGEDDVRMFRELLKQHGSKAKVIEIPVDHDITYDWTWTNLQNGIDFGYKATDIVLKAYRAGAYDVAPEATKAAVEKIVEKTLEAPAPAPVEEPVIETVVVTEAVVVETAPAPAEEPVVETVVVTEAVVVETAPAPAEEPVVETVAVAETVVVETAPAPVEEPVVETVAVAETVVVEEPAPAPAEEPAAIAPVKEARNGPRRRTGARRR